MTQVRCNDFSYVILDRFDEKFNRSVQLPLQGCGARLVHSQALQNLYETGFEVTTLITL
jgi:hypothetical protein